MPVGGQILDITKYAKPVRDAILQAIHTRAFSPVSDEAMRASVAAMSAAFGGPGPDAASAADKLDPATADDIGLPASTDEPSRAELALAMLKQLSNAPASIALQMLKAARKQLEDTAHAYA